MVQLLNYGYQTNVFGICIVSVYSHEMSHGYLKFLNCFLSIVVNTCYTCKLVLLLIITCNITFAYLGTFGGEDRKSKLFCYFPLYNVMSYIELCLLYT